MAGLVKDYAKIHSVKETAKMAKGVIDALDIIITSIDAYGDKNDDRCDCGTCDGDHVICDGDDNCSISAKHSMSNAEYYYCPNHYAVEGTCEGCGIEIHPTWDFANIEQCGKMNLYCRRCAKEQDPCDDKMQCDDCHAKEEEDLNDDGWARCTDCDQFHRPDDCVNDKE